MALPEAYEGYYNDLSTKLLYQIGTVDYTPKSTGTLKSALQKIIRPTYEKNIQTRQQATRSNRAAVDADAAARGIGSSTWVSDMKNRLQTNEARDIANINDDYTAQLYSALMSRLADQDQLSMAAQQANMAARQGALGNALSGAQYLYSMDKASSGGGGGGHGGGGGSRSNDGPTLDQYSATSKENLSRVGVRAPTTSADTAKMVNNGTGNNAAAVRRAHEKQEAAKQKNVITISSKKL